MITALGIIWNKKVKLIIVPNACGSVPYYIQTLLLINNCCGKSNRKNSASRMFETASVLGKNDQAGRFSKCRGTRGTKQLGLEYSIK